MALVARGQARAALAHFRRAVELQPDFVPARNNLGILLARGGRLDEAIEQFRIALEIDPASAEVRRNLDVALAAAARGRSAATLERNHDSGGVLGHGFSGDESASPPRDETDGRGGDEHSGNPPR